jgi:hypothetical protein
VLSNLVFASLPQDAKPTHFRRPLSANSETLLQDVIDRLKSYVKHHGSDVKSWFTDFDKYKNGYVTFNQFRRGIPQNLLSMEEEDVLIARYGFTGTVNYFKLNTHINRKAPRPPSHDQQLSKKNNGWHDEHIPVGTEDLLHANLSYNDQPSYNQVSEKIKKCIQN